MEKKSTLESLQSRKLEKALTSLTRNWDTFGDIVRDNALEAEAFVTAGLGIAVMQFYNCKRLDKANDVIQNLYGTSFYGKAVKELEIRLNADCIAKAEKSNRTELVRAENPFATFDEKARVFTAVDTASNNFYNGKDAARKIGYAWFGAVREYSPKKGELAELLEKLTSVGKYVAKHHAALAAADKDTLAAVESALRATGTWKEPKALKA